MVPKFADRGFNQFLEAYGITHRTTPPLWPRANSEVEFQNRTLLKAIRIAHAQGSNWKEDLKPFLLAYRTTPHSTTGVAPAEAFFHRRVRCKIPSIPMSSPVPHDGDMRLRDLLKNQKGKSDGDKHTRTDTIRVGDHVLLKQPKVNKLTTTFYSDPVEVIDRHGSTITVRHGGRALRRHVSHTRPYVLPEPGTQDSRQKDNTTASAIPQAHTIRQRNPPQYLKDYISSLETYV